MLHFIYNPIAGKGKSRRFYEQLTAMLSAKGLPHRFHETRGPGEAKEIARRLTAPWSGVPDIVAMGGDGTLNEVLNGLRDPASVRLGIVPCGSGNDFAAVAGIPDTPEGALLEGVAKSRGFILKGGVYDTERAARIVLDEFRAGKIARVTLEQPPKEEDDGEAE